MKIDVQEIEKKIGYSFRDKSLLQMAFTHSSFVHEQVGVSVKCNERLEFLGDSALGLVVSTYLYRHFPDSEEGILSQARAKLVNKQALGLYIKKLDIQQFLLRGKGELSRGRETSSYSDLFEALFGAIYLDGGLEGAERFFFNHFEQEFLDLLNCGEQNWKGLLQEWAQKQAKKIEYILLRVTGPDHEKEFQVEVYVNDEFLGQGKGASKKEAEREAAKEAFGRIQ